MWECSRSRGGVEGLMGSEGRRCGSAQGVRGGGVGVLKE